jgi:hypothetical protein
MYEVKCAVFRAIPEVVLSNVNVSGALLTERIVCQTNCAIVVVVQWYREARVNQ